MGQKRNLRESFEVRDMQIAAVSEGSGWDRKLEILRIEWRC